MTAHAGVSCCEHQRGLVSVPCCRAVRLPAQQQVVLQEREVYATAGVEIHKARGRETEAQKEALIPRQEKNATDGRVSPNPGTRLPLPRRRTSLGQVSITVPRSHSCCVRGNHLAPPWSTWPPFSLPQSLPWQEALCPPLSASCCLQMHGSYCGCRRPPLKEEVQQRAIPFLTSESPWDLCLGDSMSKDARHPCLRQG